MYPPVCIGLCLLVAALCLQVAENDDSKKQIVSLLYPPRLKPSNFIFPFTSNKLWEEQSGLSEIKKANETNDIQMGKVATSMIILYHLFFGLGFSTVPWVYSAEVRYPLPYQPHIHCMLLLNSHLLLQVNSLGWRTRGAAAATSVNWLGGFVVVQITKVGLDHLKWGFFLSEWLFHICVFDSGASSSRPSWHCCTKTDQCSRYSPSQWRQSSSSFTLRQPTGRSKTWTKSSYTTPRHLSLRTEPRRSHNGQIYLSRPRSCV